MFGFSFWEIGVILVVALIFLGPQKLPELARGLGKGLREFRKATEDFKHTFEEEAYKPEPHKLTTPVSPSLIAQAPGMTTPTEAVAQSTANSAPVAPAAAPSEPKA